MEDEINVSINKLVINAELNKLESLNDSKTYTDEEITKSKTYTDEEITKSKTYTDEEVDDIKIEIQTEYKKEDENSKKYIDTKKTDNETTIEIGYNTDDATTLSDIKLLFSEEFSIKFESGNTINFKVNK